MKLFKQTSVQGSTIDYTTTDVIVNSYWIIGSRDNMMVRSGNNIIETSQDSGDTWTQSIAFDTTKVNWGYIHRNGNINIGTNDNKIYFTDINLGSINENTIYDTNGVSAYTPHNPVNSLYPGSYYQVTQWQSYFSGTDLFFVACYGNAYGVGASPMNILVSKDFGETMQLAYKFGQHLNYRDNGGAEGDVIGTLLGDSSNSVVCKHNHLTEFNPYDGKIYASTGDQNWTLNSMDEIHIIDFDYNISTGLLSGTPINFGASIEKTSRLKTSGHYFVDDYIYWGSDANPVSNNSQQGLWRSKISTFSTTSTHEQVISFTDKDWGLIHTTIDPNTNFLIGTIIDYSTNQWYLMGAKDFGHGEVQYKVYPSYSFSKLNSVNDRGYARLDVDGLNANQTQSMLIKLGEDLFTNL